MVERLVGDEREGLRARRGRAGGFLRGDLAARQRGVDGDGPVRGQDHEGVEDRARADDERALEQARRGHRARRGDPDRDCVHRPEGDVQSEVLGFARDEPDVERASAACVVAHGIDDVTVDGHRAFGIVAASGGRTDANESPAAKVRAPDSSTVGPHPYLQTAAERWTGRVLDRYPRISRRRVPKGSALRRAPEGDDAGLEQQGAFRTTTRIMRRASQNWIIGVAISLWAISFTG